MKNILLIALIVITTSSINAQTRDREVVASGGGFVITPTAQASFTVGETAIQFLSTSGISLSQGFQQGNNAGMSVSNTSQIDAQVSTWPNPFVNSIEVKSDKVLHNATFQLIDANGKAIPISSVEMQAGKYWRIQIGEVASGNYWLTIAVLGSQSSYLLTHLSN